MPGKVITLNRLIFDQLYVVSDLHLGGNPRFQIFNQGNRLANFINKLAENPSTNLGLVLNGDIVDFLAEEPSAFLDSNGAIDKLKRIFKKDRAFKQVWTALEFFVSQPGRWLILVLGNHDVELALPHVREWLVQELSKKQVEARGRIITVFDGTGFACGVGNKTVLCVHGNEIDSWNIVDFHALIKVSRAINRTIDPPDWDANAGTRMVINVMNKIKKNYPMVDLLKPEIKAVVPILLALDPSHFSEIAKIVGLLGYKVKDQILMSAGWLSAEEKRKVFEKEGEGYVRPTNRDVINDLFEDFFKEEVEETDEAFVLLLNAMDRLDHKSTQDPKEYKEIKDIEFLGFQDKLKNLLGVEKNKVKILQKILRKLLCNDRTFDISYKDQSYKDLEKKVGRDVDFLIAGHTHLERAFERNYPNRYYFNSGTWIRLIEMDENVLDNESEFQKIYETFKKPDISELDKLKIGPNGAKSLIKINPTVVSIFNKNGRTVGQLNHANKDGSLVEIPNSRFP